MASKAFAKGVKLSIVTKLVKRFKDRNDGQEPTGKQIVAMSRSSNDKVKVTSMDFANWKRSTTKERTDFTPIADRIAATLSIGLPNDGIEVKLTAGQNRSVGRLFITPNGITYTKANGQKPGPFFSFHTLQSQQKVTKSMLLEMAKVVLSQNS